MAVKFSQFNVGTTISDIDYLVGYKSTDNVQIPIGLVTANTTYAVSTAQDGANESLILTGTGPASTDVITITAGNDITLTDDGAGNGFTIASTVVGDTYTIGSSTNGSSVDINLDAATGADSNITLTPAGGITITQTGNVITLDTSTSGTGTVTSVGMTMPGAFAVAGSPVTTTGTLAVTTTGGSAGQFLDYTGAWATPPSGAPTKTVDTATIANATTGTFTLTVTPSSENYVDMFISGVYQSKTTYTVAGTTVTLDGGTFFPNGAVVETVTTT